MSDTHSLTSHLKFDIPEGDVFIHAGDFTRCGGENEVIGFNDWIGKTTFMSSVLARVSRYFQSCSRLFLLLQENYLTSIKS